MGIHFYRKTFSIQSSSYSKTQLRHPFSPTSHCRMHLSYSYFEDTPPNKGFSIWIAKKFFWAVCSSHLWCLPRLFRGVGYPSLWPSASCKEPLDVSNEFTFQVIEGILSGNVRPTVLILTCELWWLIWITQTMDIACDFDRF